MKLVFLVFVLILLSHANKCFPICKPFGDYRLGPRDQFSPQPAHIFDEGNSNEKSVAGNKYTAFVVIPNGDSLAGCKIGSGKHTAVEDLTFCDGKAVWVDEWEKVTVNGATTGAKIKICGAQCFFGPVESCTTVETENGEKTTDLGRDHSSVWARTHRFAGSNTGASMDIYLEKDGDKIRYEDNRYGKDNSEFAHRVGYLYNLFSGECPYSSEIQDDDDASCYYSNNFLRISEDDGEEDSNTKRTELQRNYKRVNACMAQRDICLAQSTKTIQKQYYDGVVYSNANNCYALVQSDVLGCYSAAKDCPCSMGDENGNCGIESGFIPDVKSTYWNKLNGVEKGCYACYADIRKKLHMCIMASFDKGAGFGQSYTAGNGKFIKHSGSEAVKNIIKNLKANGKHADLAKLALLQKWYGPGDYACAYEKKLWDNLTFSLGIAAAVAGVATGGAAAILVGAAAGSTLVTTTTLINTNIEEYKQRVGCVKIGRKPGPPPFDRIARPVPDAAVQESRFISNDYQSIPNIIEIAYRNYDIPFSDLFFIYPQDTLFRIENVYIVPFADDAVGYEHRGDFYNPSINVAYGMNVKRIWFIDASRSWGKSFAARYNTTSYKFISKRTQETCGAYSDFYSDGECRFRVQNMASEWASERPIKIAHGAYNQETGEVLVSNTKFSYICARIEYDEYANQAFFIAYAVDKSSKATNLDDTCNNHEANGKLVLTGKTPRPPLKYIYNYGANITQHPINITASSANRGISEADVFLNPVINGGYVKYTGAPDGKANTIVPFTQSDGTPTADAFSVSSKMIALTYIFTEVASSDTVTRYQANIEAEKNCGYILNHKICIMPMFSVDCNLLNPSNPQAIRAEIRSGIINAPMACNGDKSCINELEVFNTIHPQCIAFKQCMATHLDASECEKYGLIQTYLGDITAGTYRNPKSYVWNYEWQDSVCITQGAERADFENGGIRSPNIYGAFEDVYAVQNNPMPQDPTNDELVEWLKSSKRVTMSNDFVITMSNDVLIPGPKVAVRQSMDSGQYDNKDLLPIKPEFFLCSPSDDTCRYNQIANSISAVNPAIAQYYFGCNSPGNIDPSCLRNNASVRQKNESEFGLCIYFDRSSKREFGFGQKQYGLSDNILNEKVYNYYVPHGCDYLEGQVLGPGGKSAQFNDDGRKAFGEENAQGSCWMKAPDGLWVGTTAIAYGTCKAVEWMGIPCFAQKMLYDNSLDILAEDTDTCANQRLHSGAGAGGGYAQGIIDVNKLDSDYFFVKPGTPLQAWHTAPSSPSEQSNPSDVSPDNSSKIFTNNAIILEAKSGGSKKIDKHGTNGGEGFYNFTYLTNGYNNACPAMQNFSAVSACRADVDRDFPMPNDLNTSMYSNYLKYSQNFNCNKCLEDVCSYAVFSGLEGVCTRDVVLNGTDKINCNGGQCYCESIDTTKTHCNSWTCASDKWGCGCNGDNNCYASNPSNWVIKYNYENLAVSSTNYENGIISDSYKYTEPCASGSGATCQCNAGGQVIYEQTSNTRWSCKYYCEPTNYGNYCKNGASQCWSYNPQINGSTSNVFDYSQLQSWCELASGKCNVVQNGIAGIMCKNDTTSRCFAPNNSEVLNTLQGGYSYFCNALESGANNDSTCSIVTNDISTAKCQYNCTSSANGACSGKNPNTRIMKVAHKNTDKSLNVCSCAMESTSGACLVWNCPNSTTQSTYKTQTDPRQDRCKCKEYMIDTSGKEVCKSWCCVDNQCKVEQKIYQDDFAARNKKIKNRDNAMKQCDALVASISISENAFKNTHYPNMCPAALVGESGGNGYVYVGLNSASFQTDWVKAGSQHHYNSDGSMYIWKDGGGNPAIKIINGFENGCQTFDDECTQYRMVKEYCTPCCSGAKIKKDSGNWHVGYYAPDSEWMKMSDWLLGEVALSRKNFSFFTSARCTSNTAYNAMSDFFNAETSDSKKQDHVMWDLNANGIKMCMPKLKSICDQGNGVIVTPIDADGKKGPEICCDSVWIPDSARENNPNLYENDDYWTCANREDKTSRGYNYSMRPNNVKSCASWALEKPQVKKYCGTKSVDLSGAYDILFTAEVFEKFDGVQKLDGLLSGQKLNKISPIIMKHPFKGSGGCVIDSSPDSEGSIKHHDNPDDIESVGGDGWIQIDAASIAYTSTGFPLLNSSGKKTLDNKYGLKDHQCSRKCPRAFIKINLNGKQLQCEYSSGDPKKAYESNVGQIMKPIKCIDKTGNIVVPKASKDRICLVTKCGGSIDKTSKRYYGLCRTSGMNIYIDRIFYSGASFFTDLATIDEIVQYCASSSSSLYTVDSFLDTDTNALMQCDHYGNWRHYLGGGFVGGLVENSEFTCPSKAGVLSGFYEDNASNCNIFGIWKG